MNVPYNILKKTTTIKWYENTTLKNGFNKTIIIFIDILGSQDRKDFDDWYRIMQLFNESVKEEKELDSSHPWTVYKREIHRYRKQT